MSHAPLSISFEAVILAGGKSSRMGRDKALLRLGGRSLLSWIRTACRDADIPCRILRKDAVPDCGPLGGILTALRSTRYAACLFLSCDMPFVSTSLLQQLARKAAQARCSVFTRSAHGVGFPAILWVRMLPRVDEAIQERSLSVQRLAVAVRATHLAPRNPSLELLNVNTPADWKHARDVFRNR